MVKRLRLKEAFYITDLRGARDASSWYVLQARALRQALPEGPDSDADGDGDEPDTHDKRRRH